MTAEEELKNMLEYHKREVDWFANKIVRLTNELEGARKNLEWHKSTVNELEKILSKQRVDKNG